MFSHGDAANKTRTLLKAESVVLLERLESTASDYACLRDGDILEAGTRQSGPPSSGLNIVGLDVSIRFGALAAAAGLMVSVITGLTIVFKSGVELTRFELSTKTAAAQTQLLDKYNSYTGNVSSMFGKPIEVFVSIAIQILILRTFQSAMLRASIGRRMDLLAFVLSASVGYLINNGFNALNVQLRPLTIQPSMSASELAYSPEVGLEDALARSSSVAATFSERSQRNPITNTVLRNLVLPRQPKTVPFCDWESSNEAELSYYYVNGSYYYFADKPIIASDFVLEYGFPQRDWQNRLLNEAIEPKVLRVALNASEANYTVPTHLEALPMNASTAADLALYSLRYFVTPFKGLEFRGFAKDTLAAKELEKSDSLARVEGFLPPQSAHADETRQRSWFLNATISTMRDILRSSSNVSLSNGAFELSHVDVSPTVAFDALTIEFEVKYASKSNRSRTSWYNNMDMLEQCGPWPAKCMVPKKKNWLDLTAQVQLFAPCANSAGEDQLTIVRNGAKTSVECAQIANSSLIVFTAGKRLVADALEQNRTANETTLGSDSEDYATATNLRMVYSLTVGKLSWVLSDIASDFNAECSDGTGACTGIVLPLDSTSKNAPQSYLVAGANALPMDLFFPLNFDDEPRYIPLVRVHEPLHFDQDSPGRMYDAMAGNLLLPHNVINTTWDTLAAPNRSLCNAYVEERVHQVLNNHLYIEHGLQTAYTAATFFLLQNGIVKDTVPLNASSMSLNFQRNSQQVAVVASIPSSNAWLTLGGCGVLVCSLCVAITWSLVTERKHEQGSSKTLEVSAPHVVARVMLDSTHFPPMFLERRARVAGAGDDRQLSVDELVIDALALDWLPDQKGDLERDPSSKSIQV